MRAALLERQEERQGKWEEATQTHARYFFGAASPVSQRPVLGRKGLRVCGKSRLCCLVILRAEDRLAEAEERALVHVALQRSKWSANQVESTVHSFVFFLGTIFADICT